MTLYKFIGRDADGDMVFRDGALHKGLTYYHVSDHWFWHGPRGTCERVVYMPGRIDE